MKREPMTFAICSAAVIIGAVVSFAAVMCLVETFGLSCDPAALIVVCCLTCGVAVAVMGLRRSWFLGFCVFFLYVCLLVWQRAAIAQGIQTILYHITSEYSHCFQVMVMGTPGGQVQWLLSALAMPLAWLCVWTVCREGHAAFVAIACAPIFVLCLLVVDLAPVQWLVLLTGALLLLILSGSVRMHSANEGARLIWWLAAPVMIVFCLLMILSPVQQYTRSTWSQSLQTMAEKKMDLKILEKQLTTAIGSGWNGDLKKVDLGRVGPKQKTGTYVLSYESDQQIPYLRGVSLGVYENNTWKNIELPYAWTTEQTQHLRPSVYTSSVNVRTAAAEPVLYTAYYPASVPGGLAVDDAYWKNGEREKSYTVTYDSNAAAEISPQYESFVLEAYTQLPRALQEPLAQILYEAGLSGGSATQIGEFVRGSGVYDLNTPAVPEGEDFALYFLTQSHQGYCIHFATSTVLLLRSAGIPARYVTGYAVDGQAQGWNQVTEDQAHAWVEYYVQGVGWQALDPTPANYREQAPEPIPEPENNAPQTRPSADTPKTPTAAPEQKQGSYWQWSLLLPGLAALILLRRLAVLYCRRYRMRKAKPNAKALNLWSWLVRLYKAGGEAVPEQWICLAEKAKFSQHVISAQELDDLAREVDRKVTQLKKASFLHCLWYKYGLILY